MKLVDLLAEALAFVDSRYPEHGYGSFHGGDPRDFSPDPDCSTEEERKAWADACERAANDEKARDLSDSHSLRRQEQSVVHVAGPGFGLGTYLHRDPRVEALRAALIDTLRANGASRE